MEKLGELIIKLNRKNTEMQKLVWETQKLVWETVCPIDYC
jgi:hypothetical protein